jgi:large subunit ribosomal protein L3
MKYIFGTKVGMTQYFTQDGKVTPVTVLEVGPLTVTQVKTEAVDGYTGVQFGYGTQKESRISKAVQGHTKDTGSFKVLKEFRTSDTDSYQKGAILSVDTFTEGDAVTVTAISKGKGFQGVVKRHGFKGGPRSHGQKHSEREPGSIGGGLRTRVPKGMRMAGRMGGDRVTVKGLKVVFVDTANNQILISGAVPGRKGTYVEVKSV